MLICFVLVVRLKTSHIIHCAHQSSKANAYKPEAPNQPENFRNFARSRRREAPSKPLLWQRRRRTASKAVQSGALYPQGWKYGQRITGLYYKPVVLPFHYLRFPKVRVHLKEVRGLCKDMEGGTIVIQA